MALTVDDFVGTGIDVETVDTLMAYLAGSTLTYIYIAIDEDMVDDAGFFVGAPSAPFFTLSAQTNRVDDLEDGDITILREQFYNDPEETSTRTRVFSAASNTSNPTLTCVSSC
tara:strand:- start:257 stop:595 length:339 start_codon:yes stop_codon:yes gene_type:complete